MKNIFRDENATVDDLVKAFLFFEQKEEVLSPQLAEVSRQAISLHQDAILGENVSESLKEVRNTQQELTYQVQACEDGKGRIIERLKTRLPLEAKAEIEVIENEVKPKLEEERAALLDQYADCLAKTIALKEALEGIWGRHYHRNFISPVGEFSAAYKNSGIDMLKKIVDARKQLRGGPSNRKRREAAHKEKEQLQVIIGNPDTALEDLLRRAGAKAFQTKPKPPLPKDRGIFEGGVRTERNVAKETGTAQYMGYRETPVSKIEYPKCWSEGHDYNLPPGAEKRVCRRCGDSECIEESSPQPEARPQCRDGQHLFSMGVCEACGHTQAVVRFG